MNIYYKYVLPGGNTFNYFPIIAFSLAGELKSQECSISFWGKDFIG